MKVLKKITTTHSTNYPSTYYRTGYVEQNCRLFGGKIESSDFDGKYYMSGMARKISYDNSFNKYLMDCYRSNHRFLKNKEND